MVSIVNGHCLVHGSFRHCFGERGKERSIRSGDTTREGQELVEGLTDEGLLQEIGVHVPGVDGNRVPASHCSTHHKTTPRHRHTCRVRDSVSIFACILVSSVEAGGQLERSARTSFLSTNWHDCQPVDRLTNCISDLFGAGTRCEACYAHNDST